MQEGILEKFMLYLTLYYPLVSKLTSLEMKLCYLLKSSSRLFHLLNRSAGRLLKCPLLPFCLKRFETLWKLV